MLRSRRGQSIDLYASQTNVRAHTAGHTTAAMTLKHYIKGRHQNTNTSFSVKPLRIASFLGVITAGVGFLYLLYILFRYFTGKTIIMGWSSTMAVLLFLGGVILLVLGLIGEYVGRIFMCTNAAPQFVLCEVVKRENHDKNA